MDYLDYKFAERAVTKNSVKEKVNQRQLDLYHLVKEKILKKLKMRMKSKWKLKTKKLRN